MSVPPGEPFYPHRPFPREADLLRPLYPEVLLLRLSAWRRHLLFMPTWQLVDELEWSESWWHDAYVPPYQSGGRSPGYPASAGVSSQTPKAVAASEAPATADFSGCLGIN